MDLSGRCWPPTAPVVWSLDGIWAWKSSSGLIDSSGHQATANAISSPTLDDSPTVTAEERAEQRAAGRQAENHGGVLTPGGGTPDAAAGSAP